METKEITGVKFEEGKDYGRYTCLKCEEIKNEDTINITANRPAPYYGEAFASGELEYIRKVAKQWRIAGYQNIHIWKD